MSQLIVKLLYRARWIAAVVCVFAIVFIYVEYRLESSEYASVYSDCHKIWSARGIYGDGIEQNSVESIAASFDLGAMGVEVDVFYDADLKKYVVSHDRPYNLKNGELLTLTALFSQLNHIGYIWLDFKKLRKLKAPELDEAIVRLEEIAARYQIKDRIYIEGSDPINLSRFARRGFFTIFDIQPLSSPGLVSGFMVDLYKTAFWLGDFSVMAMQYADKGKLRYDEAMHRRMRNVPLFLYHVPDTDKNINRLLRLSNVKVFLVGRGESINRFELDSCP